LPVVVWWLGFGYLFLFVCLVFIGFGGGLFALCSALLVGFCWLGIVWFMFFVVLVGLYWGEW